MHTSSTRSKASVLRWLAALLFAFSLIAAACGGDSDSSDGGNGGSGNGDSVSGTISVSGSSTVGPISSRVKETYNQNVSSEVEISVSTPGTSSGFREFCPGGTDINDASREIKEAEEESCAENGVTPVELRVAFDGIAVMVHPNNPLECVSLEDIYAIVGPETVGASWEEVQAFAEGAEGADGLGSTSGQTWPTGNVEIVAPGTESGTYGSFIEIALEGLGEERSDLEEGAGYYTPATDENGDPVFINNDYAGQPDDNVIITGISGSEGGFGWVGFAFAEAAGDSVKILEVQNDDGTCVAPSLETIADGSYPVSRSLYIYVSQEKLAENPALVSYVDYYLGDGYTEGVENAFDEGVGYVSLPDDLKAETDTAWDEAKAAAGV